MTHRKNVLTSIGGGTVGAIIAGVLGAITGIAIYFGYFHIEDPPNTSDTFTGFGHLFINLWNGAVCVFWGGIVGAIIGSLVGMLLVGRSTLHSNKPDL
jgi:hypothetical protein